MSLSDAGVEHDALASALDPRSAGKATVNGESKITKLKSVVSRAILECFKLGHDVAVEVLKIFRDGFLHITDRDGTESFQTMDDYLHRRAKDGVG